MLIVVAEPEADVLNAPVPEVGKAPLVVSYSDRNFSNPRLFSSASEKGWSVTGLMFDVAWSSGTLMCGKEGCIGLVRSGESKGTVSDEEKEGAALDVEDLRTSLGDRALWLWGWVGEVEDGE